MSDENEPRLDYTQIEALEAQGKKYTGNQQEHWVDNKSKCTTCRWAHIVRRSSRNTRTIYCNSISKFMPEDIADCNEYQKFTDLSLNQMGQMATLIGGLPERKVGFRKA